MGAEEQIASKPGFNGSSSQEAAPISSGEKAEDILVANDAEMRGDEVVLYQLNHGSSAFNVLQEMTEMASHTKSRQEVTVEHAHHQKHTPVSTRDLHEQFHSARQQRLSITQLGKEGDFSEGISTQDAEILLSIHGRNELVEKIKPKWKLLLEQFTGPMPIGIWLAVVVEILLFNWLDMTILLMLQFINGTVGFLEANKAGNAVAALKATLKPTAQVRRDGVWKNIDARLLVPTDCVMLSSGAAVPADCCVNKGFVNIDQSSLTGESQPVRMGKGDQAKMGSTVARGEVEATVIATGMNTFYGKTAALLQIGNEGLGDVDKLLLRVVVALLGISTILCTTTLVYLLVKGEDFKVAISFVVVLMVASIPIAIEVVVTATLALGSREISEHHAIVSHLQSIERLAGMNVLCSDKTGTLTLNLMQIQKECPVFQPGVNQVDVVRTAMLATKWNEPAKDALDTMILGAGNVADCNGYEQIEYVPFDSERKRTEATVRNKTTGEEFRVAKGAPHVLLELCADKERSKIAVEVAVLDLAGRGIRSLGVARSNAKGEWTMMGILSFLDPPRPDAKAVIATANTYGIDVKMITGDHFLVAKETAKVLCLGQANIIPCADKIPQLNLQETKGLVPQDLGLKYGEIIRSADGFSQALPEHKFVIVEALKQLQYVVGMTGDGVNDAPALKCANVGIAVHGATDAARAAADIILTTPGLTAVIEAIIIARRIFARMHSFLVYRVAATIQLLCFFFIAVIFIHPIDFNNKFPGFWSMPVIALIVITVLNDGTIVSIAYDRVKASKGPQHWDMSELWAMSIVLGSVACASSILLLSLALHSSDNQSFFASLGLPALSYGQVVVTMYLKVSLSDFMTLFSARTGPHPFFSQRPGTILLFAATIAVSMSTILSLTWPFGSREKDSGAAINGYTCLFIWIYCILWFFLQDVVKVAVFAICKRYRILELGSHSHKSARNSLSDVKVQMSEHEARPNDAPLLRASVQPAPIP